uniref:Uncharacterized protein n=1 Tax=Caudovirales sp. ctu3532 TaxID=2827639 RepID=A0A8S5TJI1_9CAUD|nr:MAG TPA: hypothetical protein [Caudovirales sp. ctu3532]
MNAVGSGHREKRTIFCCALWLLPLHIVPLCAAKVKKAPKITDIARQRRSFVHGFARTKDRERALQLL